MALTLAEAAKLSNDVLLTGVIETIVNESPILQTLPFIEIVGNGLTYKHLRTPDCRPQRPSSGRQELSRMVGLSGL